MYRMELALIIVMGVNDLHARFIPPKTIETAKLRTNRAN